MIAGGARGVSAVGREIVRLRKTRAAEPDG